MQNILYSNAFESETSLPQHLCKKCGKCCRVITTPYSHDELVKLAAQGQEDAKVFVNTFKKYNSVAEAKAVVPEYVENIINNLGKFNADFDESKLTFYYCPHLSDDNLCEIYQTRPDCCRRLPSNGWSLLAPDCAYKGWQFQQRERVKSIIRKLKEYLAELEIMPDTVVVKGYNKTVKEMKEIINSKIEPWKKYGADCW